MVCMLTFLVAMTPLPASLRDWAFRVLLQLLLLVLMGGCIFEYSGVSLTVPAGGPDGLSLLYFLEASLSFQAFTLISSLGPPWVRRLFLFWVVAFTHTFNPSIWYRGQPHLQSHI